MGSIIECKYLFWLCNHLSGTVYQDERGQWEIAIATRENSCLHCSPQSHDFRCEVLRHASAVQVLEEVGYDVKVEDMKPVIMYVSSTGISGSKHFMFYTAVDESMRSNGGGGLQ